MMIIGLHQIVRPALRIYGEASSITESTFGLFLQLVDLIWIFKKLDLTLISFFLVTLPADNFEDHSIKSRATMAKNVNDKLILDHTR